MARRRGGGDNGILAALTLIYGLMILIKNCCIFWNWVCCSEISHPRRQWPDQYYDHRKKKKRTSSYNYLSQSPHDGHDDNNNKSNAIPEDVIALAKPRYGDTGARENTAYIHDSQGTAYVALGRDLPNYYRVYPRFCNAWALELMVLTPLLVIGIVLKKATTFFNFLFCEENIPPQSALYYALVGAFTVYIPLHFVSAVLFFFYRIIKYPMKSIIYRHEVGYIDIRMNHVGDWSPVVTTAGCIFAIINPILYPIILCILLSYYPYYPKNGAVITGTELSIVALVLFGLVGTMQFCLSLRALFRRFHHHSAQEHYHATFPEGVASACDDDEVTHAYETPISPSEEWPSEEELSEEEQQQPSKEQLSDHLLPNTTLPSDGSINQHYHNVHNDPSQQQHPSHHQHHGEPYHQPPHPQYAQQPLYHELSVTPHDSKKDDDDAPPAYQQYY